MQSAGHEQPLCPKEYLLTVSNLSYELATPQQYAHIISTVSQYQLIPGFMSDMEQPWDVVLKLLPYSRQTFLDVTLPYSQSNLQPRLLARYLLFRQSVIGIKICTHSSSQKNKLEKTSYSHLKLTSKFQYQMRALPNKILRYYQEKNIQKYRLQIPVGDFYLVTNQTKIALLFQSQITNSQEINPYLQLGCQIISIVNDQEYNYEQFINNFSISTDRRQIQLGYSLTIMKISQICKQANAALIYGGCRTCPSLSKIYYSNSFIDCIDCQLGPMSSFETQFMPIVDLSKQINFIDQPEINLNRINTSQTCQLGVMRYKGGSFLNNSKQQNPSVHLTSQFKQHPAKFEADKQMYDLRPLTIKKYQKLNSRLQRMHSFIMDPRQRFFKQISLSGGSMIRCMYVFNLLNLLIFSKQNDKQSPLTLSVPFTRKCLNIFNTIVFIYDNLKQFQVQYSDLQYKIQLSDIVQLYRYKNQHLPCSLSSQYDCQAEESLLSHLSNKSIRIPILQQLIYSHNKLKPLLLCTDDLLQRRKLKQVCKQNNIQLQLIDLFMVTQFNQELDVRSGQGMEVQSASQIQQVNVLQKYKLQLRETNLQSQGVNGMKRKKHWQSPKYMRLIQYVHKMIFTTIKQAIRLIINHKDFQCQPNNTQMLKDLIINQLGKKYRNNVKTLSPICKFFISNTQQQILRRVSQLRDQFTQQRYSNASNMNSMGVLLPGADLVKPIIIFDSQQQQQWNENNVNSCNANKNDTQKNDISKKSSKNNNIGDSNDNINNKGDKQIYLKEQQKRQKTCPQHQLKKLQAQESKQKTQQQMYIQRLQRSRLIKKGKKCKTIVECHLCQYQMPKNQLQKCRRCNQTFCVDCIQQISGLSGLRAMKQWEKLCLVCKKICQCEKCKKRNRNKLNSINNRMINEMIGGSQQVIRPIFDGENNTLNKMSQQKKIENKQPNQFLTQNPASLLFKNFLLQRQLPQLTIWPCQKCMNLHPCQTRHISLQCISCGEQQCYFCIQWLYNKHSYKPANNKWFYKSWKCRQCDTQLHIFFENKRLQKQQLNKKINDNQMVSQLNELDFSQESKGTEQIVFGGMNNHSNSNMEVQRQCQFKVDEKDLRFTNFELNPHGRPVVQAQQTKGQTKDLPQINIQQRKQEKKSQIQLPSKSQLVFPKPLQKQSFPPSINYWQPAEHKGISIVYPPPKVSIQIISNQKQGYKTKQQPGKQQKNTPLSQHKCGYDESQVKKSPKKQQSIQINPSKSGSKWEGQSNVNRSSSKSRSKSKDRSIYQHNYKNDKNRQTKAANITDRQPRQMSRQRVGQTNARKPWNTHKNKQKILKNRRKRSQSYSSRTVSSSESEASSSSSSQSRSLSRGRGKQNRNDRSPSDRRNRDQVSTRVTNYGTKGQIQIKQKLTSKGNNRVQIKGIDSERKDRNKDRSRSGSKNRDHRSVNIEFPYHNNNITRRQGDKDDGKWNNGRFSDGQINNYQGSDNYKSGQQERFSQNIASSNRYSQVPKPPNYTHRINTVVVNKDINRLDVNGSNYRSQTHTNDETGKPKQKTEKSDNQLTSRRGQKP